MISTANHGFSVSPVHALLADRPNVEAVIVTPYDGHAQNVAPLEDVAFPSRCAFSWQSAIVTRSTPTGRLSFKTYRYVACFDSRLLSRYPRVGDHVMRTWDGMRFQIVDICWRSAHELICDIVEIASLQ